MVTIKSTWRYKLYIFLISCQLISKCSLHQNDEFRLRKTCWKCFHNFPILWLMVYVLFSGSSWIPEQWNVHSDCAREPQYSWQSRGKTLICIFIFSGNGFLLHTVIHYAKLLAFSLPKTCWIFGVDSGLISVYFYHCSSCWKNTSKLVQRLFQCFGKFHNISLSHQVKWCSPSLASSLLIHR